MNTTLSLPVSFTNPIGYAGRVILFFLGSVFVTSYIGCVWLSWVYLVLAMSMPIFPALRFWRLPWSGRARVLFSLARRKPLQFVALRNARTVFGCVLWLYMWGLGCLSIMFGYLVFYVHVIRGAI